MSEGTVMITGAYLGDERSAVEITKSLTQKLAGSSNQSVDVNSSLIPLVQVEGSTELTDDQIREAQDRADLDCEGSSDNACAEIKFQEYLRKMIREKLNSVQSRANLVKGRAMVVSMDIDGQGDKTFVIPEGQEFKLQDIVGDRQLIGDPSMGIPEVTSADIFGEIGVQLLKALGIIAATAVYVFSIVATYKVFIQAGYTYIGYLATASAVFIPYSGIIITLIFFALREFVLNRPKIST